MIIKHVDLALQSPSGFIRPLKKIYTDETVG